MIRHLRLYRVFLENCFVREAEFRANFWANLVTNAGWLFFFVAFIKVVYLHTPRVAGWTEPEAMVLTGTFGLVQGIFSIVAYQNLSRFPEMIRLGTLDFVITKPVSSLFLVSMRYVKLDSIGSAVGAAVVVGYGLRMGGTLPAAPSVLAYLWMAACALVIYFSVYTLLMTLAFWLVRVENLAVLSDVVFQAGRYPVDIFHGWVWRLFVYAIPLAFVASFPARALFGKLEPGWMVLGTALAAGLFIASLLFWRVGVRSYASASS